MKAFSVATTLASDVSRVLRTPLFLPCAAWSTSSRDVSYMITISATMSWTIWYSAIGLPKVSRWLA